MRKRGERHAVEAVQPGREDGVGLRARWRNGRVAIQVATRASTTPVTAAKRQSSSTKPQSSAKEKPIIVTAAILARGGITPCVDAGA